MHNKNTNIMKKFLGLLLLLWVPAVMMAQGYSKYDSREEDEYDKNHKRVRMQPLSIEEVKCYKNDFFDFERIENYTPYNDTLFFAPYQDSVFRHCRPYFWDRSVRQYIGKVDRMCILKHEKQGQIETFLYEGNAYDDLPGIWVAYSSDEGKSWDYYYTGVVQKKPLYVKWYSGVPLINNQGDLQVEACLFIQKAEFGPWGMEYFNLAEDGLLLTLDLATLQKDTDGDGLTDITESLFLTNPNEKDTDGDGITDDLDLNPRFALPRTDKTIVFETVLNVDDRLYSCQDGPCELIPLDEITPVHYATDTTVTVMVISDDPDLLSVQPVAQRIIFVTSEEYAQKQHHFTDELGGYDITPLFKCDYEADTWVFSKSSRTGSLFGSGYYAKKTKDGWEIGNTYMIIE